MSTYKPLSESFYSPTLLSRVQATRPPSPDAYRLARQRVRRDAPDLIDAIFGGAA